MNVPGKSLWHARHETSIRKLRLHGQEAAVGIEGLRSV